MAPTLASTSLPPPDGNSGRRAGLQKAPSLVKSPYTTIARVFRKAEESDPLPAFPQFTRLPEELQLKIWYFAAQLPHVLRMGQLLAKRKPFGKSTYYYKKIVNLSGGHLLLLTTFVSRQMALRALGDGFTFHSNISGHRASYTIRFNPGNDTILVADITSLDSLSLYYTIWPRSNPPADDRPEDRRDLGLVKSLAFETLRIPTNLRMILGDNASYLLQDYMSTFMASILEFRKLEELILVDTIVRI